MHIKKSAISCRKPGNLTSPKFSRWDSSALVSGSHLHFLSQVNAKPARQRVGTGCLGFKFPLTKGAVSLVFPPPPFSLRWMTGSPFFSPLEPPFSFLSCHQGQKERNAWSLTVRVNGVGVCLERGTGLLWCFFVVRFRFQTRSWTTVFRTGEVGEGEGQRFMGLHWAPGEGWSGYSMGLSRHIVFIYHSDGFLNKASLIIIVKSPGSLPHLKQLYYFDQMFFFYFFLIRCS